MKLAKNCNIKERSLVLSWRHPRRQQAQPWVCSDLSHAWEGPSSSLVKGEVALDVPLARMVVTAPKHWTAGARGPSLLKDRVQVCLRTGSVSTPSQRGTGYMEDEVCDMQIHAHGCAHACASMPTEGTLAARNMCARVHKQARTKLTLTQKGLLPQAL